MNPYFSMTNAELRDLRDSGDPGADAELERRMNKRAAVRMSGSHWEDEIGRPVDFGSNMPTHFAYVTVRSERGDIQYIVAGFGPVARFYDGMVVQLEPSRNKHIEPLEDRVAARAIYRYYSPGEGPPSHPPQTR